MRTEKNMKKELIFPLIIGLILGVLVMLFWQFNSKLNNQRAILIQLEQAVSTNTKTIGDVVNFINTAANPQGANNANPSQSTPPAETQE